MYSVILRFVVFVLFATSLFFATSQYKSVHAMNFNPNTLLTCQLTGEANQSISQGVLVTYSITNTSTEPLFLLPWYTPLEGFMSKLFNLVDEQHNVLPYQGPMIKRMMPKPDDFIVIAAGETVSAQLDLQQAYHLEKTQYQLSLIAKDIPIIFNQQAHTIQLCKEAKLTINVT